MSGMLEGIFGSPEAPVPSVSQAWSPQQQQLWGMALPMIQQGLGGQLPQWGGYEIPQMQQPTAGWYQGLDPSVRAGIEEPYMRGMDMMRNQLQGGGQLGAPRAGMSGAAADVFGQYAQKAGQGMAQTGWGMMQPGYENMWQAQLGQNQQGAQMGFQQSMYPFQMAQGLLGASMPENIYTQAPPNPWSQMLPNMASMGGAMGIASLFSDRRLKKNIRYLKPIGRVKPCLFQYIWDKTKWHIGVVAQDLLKVYPEFVKRIGHFYAVDYFGLIKKLEG